MIRILLDKLYVSLEKIYPREVSTAYNLGRSNDRTHVAKPLQDYSYFITGVVMTPSRET
jgi:hypothetical protein